MAFLFQCFPLVFCGRGGFKSAQPKADSPGFLESLAPTFCPPCPPSEGVVGGRAIGHRCATASVLGRARTRGNPRRLSDFDEHGAPGAVESRRKITSRRGRSALRICLEMLVCAPCFEDQSWAADVVRDRLWSFGATIPPTVSGQAGTRWREPPASMTFVGGFSIREHAGIAHHVAERSWTKLWAVRRNTLTMAVPLRHRLQRLGSDVFPVLTWGVVACRPERKFRLAWLTHAPGAWPSNLWSTLLGRYSRRA